MMGEKRSIRLPKELDGKEITECRGCPFFSTSDDDYGSTWDECSIGGNPERETLYSEPDAKDCPLPKVKPVDNADLDKRERE